MNKNVSIKDYPYVYRHIEPYGCNGSAFYLSHRPAPQSHVLSRGTIQIDGSEIPPCSKRICGECGHPLGPMATKWIFKRKVK